MVIAVRAVLIALLVVRHILAERLLALLAHEGHLGRLPETVVLTLRVALSAVEPLLAAWRTDGDLRVQNVFAAIDRSR